MFQKLSVIKSFAIRRRDGIVRLPVGFPLGEFNWQVVGQSGDLKGERCSAGSGRLLADDNEPFLGIYECVKL